MSLRPDEVSDDPLHAANEIIRLERERDALRSQLEEARTEAAWDDKPTKYDEAIAAAHPTRTKEYRRYDLAVELVGAKRSKYALVDLVNWCLSTHPETEALRSDLQAARDRIGALTEAIDGHDQCENGDLVADVTACIRRADLRFEKSGGSSRHWVRECMLPELNAARFVVVRRAALAPAPGAVCEHDFVPRTGHDSTVLCMHCDLVARADGEAPTREETTTGPCGCPLHLGLLHAQQGCPKERRLARVDPFDMPRNGGGNHG